VVELELKMQELHEKLTETVNNLQSKVRANEALNADLEALRSVTQKLENTVSSLHDENEGLMENLKLAKKERDDYMIKEQKSGEDLKLAKKERDDYMIKEQNTAESLKLAKKERDDFKAKQEKASKDLEFAQKEREEYRTKMEATKKSDEDNKKVWSMRLEDMQKKQVKYKKLNKALREANDTLMKSKTDLEKEKTELATENYNLLTENANLEERVDELEDQEKERAVHKTFGNWLYKEKYAEQIRQKDSMIEKLQEDLNKLNDLMKSEQYHSDNDSGETTAAEILLSQLPVTKPTLALPGQVCDDVLPSARPDGTPEWNENDLAKLENLMESIKTTEMMEEHEKPTNGFRNFQRTQSVIISVKKKQTN